MHMVRSLSLVLSLSILIPLHAQQQFGVLAGPQYALVSQVFKTDLPEGLKVPSVNGFGVYGGVWYRSDRSHIVQFRLGLDWSYRTFDQDYERMELDTTLTAYLYKGTTTWRLHYLEVPVQASYCFWRNAHVDLGLTPAYLVTGRTNDEGQVTFVRPDGSTYQPASYKSSVKDLDPYKRVELAATLGVGYDFSNGLVAGLSCSRALGRMNDEEQTLYSRYYNLFRVWFGYDLLHEKRRRPVFRRHTG